MPRAIALVLFSGLLFGLSFPSANITFLIWFFLLPLFLVKSDSFRQSFLQGWLTGFSANLIIFFWLWATFRAAEMNPGLTFFCWTMLAAILGIYVALFWGCYFLVPNRWFKPLVGAALWVTLDFLKTHILTGFPWTLLAHTQAFQPSVIQVASVTGAEGVTFLIVLVNLTLGLFWQEIQFSSIQARWRVVVASAVPMVLVGSAIVGMGLIKSHHPESSTGSSLNIAVLQGNIDQYRKWDSAFEKEIRNSYEKLALEAVRSSPEKIDLIVWPESSLPGWFPNDKFYLFWVKHVAQLTQTFHLIGAVSSRNPGDTNSAFLIAPNGDITARYDKQHLVPFGEYIPFGKFAGRWIPYLGQMGVFQAGKGPSLFMLKSSRVTPNICYEAIFPDLVRRSVRLGAGVIVNITNDGWYLDTGAPLQHFVVNIFRAVENGRPVVRAANTGISGIIDARGRVLVMTKLGQTLFFHRRVHDSFGEEETLYVKWGPWFSWVCTFVTLLSLGFTFQNRASKII